MALGEDDDRVEPGLLDGRGEVEREVETGAELSLLDCRQRAELLSFGVEACRRIGVGEALA
jgi:hypothetical protein